MKQSTPKVNCPTCNTPVIMSKASPFRPFCSSRCKSIDFGEWALEDKKIPGEFIEDELWSEDQNF